MKNIVILACSSCKRRNYTSRMAKKQIVKKKLELKKYCRFCRKHTLHKQIK